MSKLYKQEGKRKVLAVKYRCDNCNVEFLLAKRFLDKSEKHYCSQKCAKEALQTGVYMSCDNPDCMNTVYVRKNQLTDRMHHYCCRECKDKCNERKTENPTINTYRDRTLECQDCCEICGYNTIKNILEVHHIDRDRTNNSPKNLIALCPNCHIMVHKGFISILC